MSDWTLGSASVSCSGVGPLAACRRAEAEGALCRHQEGAGGASECAACCPHPAELWQQGRTLSSSSSSHGYSSVFEGGRACYLVLLMENLESTSRCDILVLVPDVIVCSKCGDISVLTVCFPGAAADESSEERHQGQFRKDKVSHDSQSVLPAQKRLHRYWNWNKLT